MKEIKGCFSEEDRLIKRGVFKLYVQLLIGCIVMASILSFWFLVISLAGWVINLAVMF